MEKSEAKERVNKIRKTRRLHRVALIGEIIIFISFCVIGLLNFSNSSVFMSAMVIGALFLALAVGTWEQSRTIKTYEAYISELKENAARSKRADNQESE